MASLSSQWRSLPSDTAVRSEDFNLLPLDPANLEHTSTKIHPTEPGAVQNPNTDSRGHQVDILTHRASGMQGWTPFFRRRPVLVGFAILFLGLMIVLATLYGYSQAHQGLSSANQNDHYLWTYGPTAG